MWEHNLDCFTMLPLRVTWRIQYHRQEEFCVFLEASRVFQLGGPVRNPLLYLTVVLNRTRFVGRWSASRWTS